jgi:hypothetical protein
MQPEIVYSWKKFPLGFPTKEEKMGMMLSWLEEEGFHLYYDEKTSDWELFKDEDTEFSLTGKDKEDLIVRGFHYLSH